MLDVVVIFEDFAKELIEELPVCDQPNTKENDSNIVNMSLIFVLEFKVIGY